ncbi:MAG: acyloxyacyl hydrolase [Rhodospirillales bacterium]|nr:acyloxyacyl hydrolase [Rhodospirillales bacterium]
MALAAALLAFGAPDARAQAEDPSFLSISGGKFDANRQKNPSAEFGIDYRSDLKLWIFQPMVGAMANADGGLNAYAGISLDLFFGDRVVLRPSFAPGVYRRGNSLDLGYTVEFRSGIEAAFRFDDRSRLGLELYHLSNAGLGKTNPGEESLVLRYSVPVTKLFGP